MKFKKIKLPIGTCLLLQKTAHTSLRKIEPPIGPCILLSLTSPQYFALAYLEADKPREGLLKLQNMIGSLKAKEGKSELLIQAELLGGSFTNPFQSTTPLAQALINELQVQNISHQHNFQKFDASLALPIVSGLVISGFLVRGNFTVNHWILSFMIMGIQYLILNLLNHSNHPMQVDLASGKVFLQNKGEVKTRPSESMYSFLQQENKDQSEKGRPLPSSANFEGLEDGSDKNQDQKTSFNPQ